MCHPADDVRRRYEAIGHRLGVAAEYDLATAKSNASMGHELPLRIDVRPDLASPGTRRFNELHLVSVGDRRSHG